MAKTFLDGLEVKKWLVDNVEVIKAYMDGRPVYTKPSGAVDIEIPSTGIDLLNFDYTVHLEPYVLAQLGTWDNKTNVVITIPAGVTLVSADIRDAVIKMPDGWAGRMVTIVNKGLILGRGGNGGQAVGGAGRIAILNALGNNVQLVIDNQGQIGGGGGAGGTCGVMTGGGPIRGGGGGGAPLGLGAFYGGSYPRTAPGANGTLSAGGLGGGINYYGGVSEGGRGGSYGSGGAQGSGRGGTSMIVNPVPGGAAGAAISGTVTYIKRGTIYGSAP